MVSINDLVRFAIFQLNFDRVLNATIIPDGLIQLIHVVCFLRPDLVERDIRVSKRQQHGIGHPHLFACRELRIVLEVDIPCAAFFAVRNIQTKTKLCITHQRSGSRKTSFDHHVCHCVGD